MNTLLRNKLGLALIFASLTSLSQAAPITNVFPGAPNVSPNWDNLAAAVADTDSGGTVLVQPGLYEITASINLDKPISIIGPLDGVDTASTGSGTRVGTGVGGYTRDTLSQGEASFAANLTTTNVISLGASNITIAGLDFETSSAAYGILRSPVGLGLSNITIRDNVFRRATVAAANANSQHAMRIENATSVSISGNSARNLRGANSGSPDHGVYWLNNVSSATLRKNEVRNSTASDRSAGFLVDGTANNILLERNKVWADFALGESCGKYGISSTPGTSNEIMVRYNEILDYEQAAIAVQRNGYVIIGNTLSGNEASVMTSSQEASIYIRDNSVTKVTIRNNKIVNNSFLGASRVRAGVRFQAFGAGLVSNGSLVDNNIYSSNRQVGVTPFERVSLGIQATTTFGGSACGNALDLRNSWWGSANGPRSVQRAASGSTYGGTLAAALATDPCAAVTLTESTSATSGTGESLGNGGRNSTQPLRFFPWALFRGDFAFAGPGTGALTIPGENTPPLGNDRYWKHNLTVNGLSTEGRLQIWPSANRQGIDNSADFSVDGAGFTTATITVHYQPGAESILDESTVRLVKWNAGSGTWIEVPGQTLDTVENTVTATVSELGQYAARENGGAPLTDLNGSGSGENTSGNFVATAGPLAIANVTEASFQVSSANLTSASAVLDVAPDGANEVLTADTTGTGITASYNVPSRTLLLSGTDTVANYTTVLRTIRYNNTAGAPTNGVRVVSVSASNAYGTGNSATSTISSVVLPVSLTGMSVE